MKKRSARSVALAITALLIMLPCISSLARKKARRTFDISMLDRLAPSCIISEGADSLITISGFDKPLSSGYETFFAGNEHDRTLLKLWIKIVYLTTDGRLLHSRCEVIRTEIPPSESRQIELRTFDRQHSFYYYKSRKPRNTEGVAPFRVSVSIDSAAFATTEPK